MARTLAVVAIIPKALNVSYNNLSSTLSSKLPMNKFAPTSSCFLSEDAYSLYSVSSAATMASVEIDGAQRESERECDRVK